MKTVQCSSLKSNHLVPDDEEFQRLDHGSLPKTQFFHRLRHSSSSLSLPSYNALDGDTSLRILPVIESKQSLRAKRAASQLFLSRRSSVDLHRDIQVDEKSLLLNHQENGLTSEHKNEPPVPFQINRGSSRVRPPMSRIFWTIAAILVFLMSVFSLLLLTIQPLSHLHHPVILKIAAFPDFYGLHMSLTAQNGNLVMITVQDADLDVLASAGNIQKLLLHAPRSLCHIRTSESHE